MLTVSDYRITPGMTPADYTATMAAIFHDWRSCALPASVAVEAVAELEEAFTSSCGDELNDRQHEMVRGWQDRMGVWPSTGIAGV